jgi:hypothetical protein
MAAITSPDYPGERLIVCCNGELAAERWRSRSRLKTFARWQWASPARLPRQWGGRFPAISPPSPTSPRWG